MNGKAKVSKNETGWLWSADCQYMPIAALPAVSWSTHIRLMHSCAGERSTPPSLYWPSTNLTSVESQRMCTFSHPTLSMSLAVAHMQIHQESPGFGSDLICWSHCHYFWPVIVQKSSWPQARGFSSLLLSKSWAHTLCVPSWLHLKSPYLGPSPGHTLIS